MPIEDIDEVFRSDDRELLEKLVREARDVTEQYFGRTMGLYAPLYISNYCRNNCVYCGFRVHAKIPREKLSMAGIDRECRALSAMGINNCLILTGESRSRSSPGYIRDAIVIAREYFSNIALEIYPLDTEEYRELYLAGADGVTIYQETYDRKRYDELHPAGPKKNYDYRLDAPDRIAQAGFRHIGLGALLGLAPWQEDVPRLFSHLRRLERIYPGVEYSLSFPRLRPTTADKRNYHEVTDRDMVKIIAMARLIFPRVGITISTRENARFRDHVIGLGVTRMSAGSSTTVGGYADGGKGCKEGQFHVHDLRTLSEIKAMLVKKGFDPVATDWRHIVNR